MSESTETPTISEPEAKRFPWLSATVIAGLLGLSGFLFKRGDDRAKVLNTQMQLQNEGFEKEKQAMIRENADKILNLSKTYKDNMPGANGKPPFTPVEIWLTAPDKATFNFLDLSGAKQELKDIPVKQTVMPKPEISGKPPVMSPVQKAVPIAPVVPVAAVVSPQERDAWLAKEKDLNAQIGKLKAENETLRAKIKAAPAELNAGDFGWTKIGELEGTSVVKTPFDKSPIPMDPDPSVKFTLKEPRELVAKSDGGQVIGTLKPGRLVTITQIKIQQGAVYALLVVSK
jgi:outer membrane murein-binding lipoprotein Lpp